MSLKWCHVANYRASSFMAEIIDYPRILLSVAVATHTSRAVALRGCNKCEGTNNIKEDEILLLTSFEEYLTLDNEI